MKIRVGPLFSKIQKSQKRILVLRGGSSSSKTYSVIQHCLLWLLTGEFCGDFIPTGNLSVVRKYRANLTKSVLRDFENILDSTQIDAKGNTARRLVHINKTDLTYSYNGRTLEFFGADDPQKLRGPRRTLLYCNEANELDYEDFRQLVMRTSNKIIIDFNPDDEDIWINTEIEQKRAVAEKDVDLIVSTYRDNPFLSSEIVKELERLRDTDPIYWQVYGEGQYGRLEGRIFDFKDIEEVPKEARLLGYGLDFGYTNDPTALIGVYEYGDALILDEEVYEPGLTNPDIVRKLQNAEIAKSTEIWADSSEPKSIEEIYRSGYNIHAVEKGPDSVRFGIDIMKQYTLYVTARSLNLRKEGRKYIWKKDKNGKSLNIPIDDFNHAIDACRYLIMTKKKKQVVKKFRFDVL